MSLLMITVRDEEAVEPTSLWTHAPVQPVFFPPLYPSSLTQPVFVPVFSRQLRRLRGYWAGICIPTWLRSGLVGRRSWLG